MSTFWEATKSEFKLTIADLSCSLLDLGGFTLQQQNPFPQIVLHLPNAS